MSDLISRKEAIKTVKFYETFYDPYPRVVEAVEELPSVQPTPCEFCKHNNIADDKACLMCSAERRTNE